MQTLGRDWSWAAHPLRFALIVGHGDGSDEIENQYSRELDPGGLGLVDPRILVVLRCSRLFPVAPGRTLGTTARLVAHFVHRILDGHVFASGSRVSGAGGCESHATYIRAHDACQRKVEEEQLQSP